MPPALHKDKHILWEFKSQEPLITDSAFKYDMLRALTYFSIIWQDLRKINKVLAVDALETRQGISSATI